MATKKPSIPVSKQDQTLPFSLDEQGYQGWNIFNGISQDEVKRELVFPNSIKVFKQMSMHSSVASALTLYDSLIGKVKWKVRPPEEPTKKELSQTKFIEECMGDMEHTFQDFIKDVLSANQFGFSVHEKVFRQRLTENGSMYSDGKIGWKKLPIRSQETINRFLFSQDGNDIVGVEQSFPTSDPAGRYAMRTDMPRLSLGPVGKAMLFRVGKHRGVPTGASPLKDAYIAWRYLTELEQLEAHGIARDLKGLPVLKIPPQYMSNDATPEQKQIYDYYKNVLRNMQSNQQSGLILPTAFDENKQPLFSLELLNSAGQKSHDIDKAKTYYINSIYTSLSADLLVLGQGSTGSFALGQIKNSLIGAYAENLINGIIRVLNEELIKHTYILNGFDQSRACTFDIDNLEAEDLEVFSKAVQRFASTSMLEVDRPVLNRIRRAMGVDELAANLEPQQELMPSFNSKSGSGMEVGTTGNGTATSVSGADNSSNNLDNTA